MLVFRSRSFRNRACFVYLFWESFTNVFFFNLILVTRVLQGGFQIPIMPRYGVACKVREFLSEYIFQIANTLFVCATLDRLLSTQRSMGKYESVRDTALRRRFDRIYIAIKISITILKINRNINLFVVVIAFRRWSNRVSLAHKLVPTFAVLWLLVLGHRLVLYTNSTGSCGAQEGVYALFDTYLEVCLSGVFTPLIVLVLAYLLLRSTRSVIRRRVIHGGDVPSTLATNTSHLQRIEAQLTMMLFLQSLNAIIAFFPYAAQVLYVNITDGWEKSPERQAWEKLTVDTIRLCSYLFAATGFYISMISNRGFREQFMRMIGMETNLNHANPTIVTINRITIPSVPPNQTAITSSINY